MDPQVQVGLLVDPSGFPLEIHLFEGNKAETKTLIPVLATFAQRHQVSAIAEELNDRPRAALGFLTPREAFERLLTDTVATTP